MINLNTLIIIDIALVGLVIGSFLNVVILRTKKGQSFVKGRSKCPHCKKELNFFDLVPVLSFLFLRGRCRYCRKKISLQYPLVEFSTSLSFVFLYLNLNLIKENITIFKNLNDYLLFAFMAAIFSCLIVVFVFDLLYYLIPDEVVLFGFILTAVLLFYARYVTQGGFLYPHFLGMLIFSGFFAFQYLISGGKWVGWGDAKLGLFLGLLINWKLTLVSLMLAYLTGAIVSVGLIALHKKTRKDIIPFGPFLIVSTVISIFWGNTIIAWYLGLLQA